MTKQTKQQNRAACKRAVDLYINGNKAAAKETAKRVSWAFMFHALMNDFYCVDQANEYTNAIKGRIEIY